MIARLHNWSLRGPRVREATIAEALCHGGPDGARPPLFTRVWLEHDFQIGPLSGERSPKVQTDRCPNLRGPTLKR